MKSAKKLSFAAFSSVAFILLLSLFAVNVNGIFAQYYQKDEVPAPYTDVRGALCARFSKSTPVPTQYGPAYNVFSANKETIVEILCGPGIPIGIVGRVSTNPVATWGQAWKYSFKDRKWQSITVEGTPFVPSATGSQRWLKGPGTFAVPQSSIEDGQNYIATWQALYVNGSWKSGCVNTSCSQQAWTIQSFDDEELVYDYTKNLATDTACGVNFLKPNGCSCELNNECNSLQCSSGKCVQGKYNADLVVGSIPSLMQEWWRDQARNDDFVWDQNYCYGGCSGGLVCYRSMLGASFCVDPVDACLAETGGDRNCDPDYVQTRCIGSTNLEVGCVCSSTSQCSSGTVCDVARSNGVPIIGEPSACYPYDPNYPDASGGNGGLHGQPCIPGTDTCLSGRCPASGVCTSYALNQPGESCTGGSFDNFYQDDCAMDSECKNGTCSPYPAIPSNNDPVGSSGSSPYCAYYGTECRDLPDDTNNVNCYNSSGDYLCGDQPDQQSTPSTCYVNSSGVLICTY